LNIDYEANEIWLVRTRTTIKSSLNKNNPLNYSELFNYEAPQVDLNLRGNML